MECSGDSEGSDEDPSIPASSRLHRARAPLRSPSASFSLAPDRTLHWFSPLPRTTGPADLTSVEDWPPLVTTVAGPSSASCTSSIPGSLSSTPALSKPLQPLSTSTQPAGTTSTAASSPPPSTAAGLPPPLSTTAHDASVLQQLFITAAPTNPACTPTNPGHFLLTTTPLPVLLTAPSTGHQPPSPSSSVSSHI